MKDIIITSKKIKRERNIYILCFVLAFIINIIAIIVYTRPWVEMFSQIGYVFVISLFIYFILWIPRLLFIGGKSLFKKKRNAHSYK